MLLHFHLTVFYVMLNLFVLLCVLRHFRLLCSFHLVMSFLHHFHLVTSFMLFSLRSIFYIYLSIHLSVHLKLIDWSIVIGGPPGRTGDLQLLSAEAGHRAQVHDDPETHLPPGWETGPVSGFKAGQASGCRWAQWRRAITMKARWMYVVIYNILKWFQWFFF